jgi:hypothetical protein
MHNNKMERMNGEIRDREKTMRGLKKDATAILQGYQLCHSYIRTHEALDGKTPSEAVWNNNRRKEQVENSNTKCK